MKLSETIKELSKSVAEFFSKQEKVKLSIQKVKGSEQYIEYASLEIGQGVQISISDAGDEATAAPNGSYELEDGTKIVVKEGKIESFETPVKSEDVKVEEKMADATATVDIQAVVTAAIQTALQPVWDKLYALEALYNADKAIMTSQKEVNGFIADKFKAVVQILEKLQATPAESSKTNEKADYVDDVAKRKAELSEMLQKFSQKN